MRTEFYLPAPEFTDRYGNDINDPVKWAYVDEYVDLILDHYTITSSGKGIIRVEFDNGLIILRSNESVTLPSETKKVILTIRLCTGELRHILTQTYTKWS